MDSPRAAASGPVLAPTFPWRDRRRKQPVEVLSLLPSPVPPLPAPPNNDEGLYSKLLRHNLNTTPATKAVLISTEAPQRTPSRARRAPTGSCPCRSLPCRRRFSRSRRGQCDFPCLRRIRANQESPCVARLHANWFRDTRYPERPSTPGRSTHSRTRMDDSSLFTFAL